LRERDEIRVVDDQRGAPTHVGDLAAAIATLVRGAPYGVYHVTNVGAGSWYDVACTVREALGTGGRVRPCTTAEFPRPAVRPRNSRLAMAHWEAAGLPALRPWTDAVRDYVSELGREGVA
jgi:dTDP-4-dehydrorhamnose reductase